MEDAAPRTLGPSTRIESIDLLRGIVVVLMALDHVRDYFHFGEISPTDLSQASLGLFFTRFVTHFCAPTFVLLAGTGAALFARSRPLDVARFLVERGFVLILLELTVINLSWPYLYMQSYKAVFVQVLWVLGISMILLGALIRLGTPRSVLLAGSLLMIFGHNLLDGFKATDMGAWGFLWGIFHEKMFWLFTETFYFFITYPLLPWPAVMVLGYLLGELYTDSTSEGTARRRRFLFAAGSGAMLLFLGLRLFNAYGNPVPWEANPRGWAFTLASFVNTEKYPPSLHFLLMTLGPVLLLLPLLERFKGRLAAFFLDFGRVPLFFYVVHFSVIYLAEIFWSMAFYGRVSLINEENIEKPANFVVSLPRTYFVWLLLLLAMRPACRAFLAYRKRSTRKWVKYF